MKIKEKQEAIKLRKKGYSLNEIYKMVSASKSTISVWIRDINLSNKARERLKNKTTLASIKSQETQKNKRNQRVFLDKKFAIDILNKIKLNKNSSTLLCALIYWCEGNKSEFDTIAFTNSDPNLVKKFLELLRTSFVLDESKFRVVLHLHNYHDSLKQIRFWSKITQIPKKQFTKPYIKKNTGKIIRKNYPGCINLKYYDITIARKLREIAKLFLQDGSIG